MRNQFKNTTSSRKFLEFIGSHLSTILIVAYIFINVLSIILLFSDTSLTTKLICAAVLALCPATAYIAYKLIIKRYDKFVREHSIAYKRLVAINSLFDFQPVPNLDMMNSYDNENFYSDISPLDYLTYQLVYQKKQVLNAIEAAAKNADLYSSYLERVCEICEFDKYDTESIPKLTWLRKRHEKAVLNKTVRHPITKFEIFVVLRLTRLNGFFRHAKSELFDSYKIQRIIEALSHKNGDFYTDENIWQSICRVERGRVSNKIRFAVYRRDGNRCRRCGSTYNLEVDHIFPISKGGKSNFDNLQTLCHNCNAAKSNKIEFGAIDPRAKRREHNETCPICSAPLVLRNGKYNKFYGCANYPRCKFTKNT